MKTNFHQSIATPVILAILVVVTLLLVIVGTFGFKFYSNTKWEEFRLKNNIQADQLATGSALALWNFDSGQINKIMEGAMLDKPVYAIYLDAGAKGYGLSRDENWQVRESLSNKEYADVVELKRSIVFNGEEIGALRLYVSSRFLAQNLDKTRNVLVALIVLFDLVLIFSLYGLIWQRVLQPLKRIEAYAKSISAGQEVEISEKHDMYGEFGELRSALKIMVELLESRLIEVQQSNGRFWHLIREFPLALALYSPESGKIQFMNSMFCELFGYSTKEIPDAKTWFKLAYPDEEYRRDVEIRWQRAIENAVDGSYQVESDEYRIVCKNGETKIVEIGGVSAGNEVLAVFIDITERNRAENEVRSYQEHLEELVQQRTEELVIARDLAESANRSKSLFLANMSHELRTPLNSVIGFSKLMASDKGLSEAQQKHLDIINKAGNHLLTLINDILELSKIDAGKLILTEDSFSLKYLLSDVIDMLKAKADQKGISLQFDCLNLPEYVITDGAKLRQVIINLVSNAIKFTNRGGVSLVVNVASEGDKAIANFRVIDTGIGISEEERERVFSPFEQLDQSGESSGTGLGLAISRKYVELLGGELSVSSSSDGGSIFQFSLTFDVTDKAPSLAATEDRQVLSVTDEYRGYKLLIADDSDEMRLLLREVLEPLGLEVSEAKDGEEAKQKILNENPNLVLMDWRMPKIDGVSLTKEIRSTKFIDQPRIIMLSANAFKEDRMIALVAGVDDFMAKPIELDGLYAIIKRHAGINYKVKKDQKHHQELDLTDFSPGEINNLTENTKNNFVRALRELNQEKMLSALADLKEENSQLANTLKLYVDRIQFRELWQYFGIFDESA